jgi:DNA-binding MarR family transcriptional regulator
VGYIYTDVSVEMYHRDMDALDLIVLGRHLVKIGEEALRGGSAQTLPSGRSLVLRDVFANPESSISEITTRTGLPQSYVSELVATLRDQGVIEVLTDPADRRRTLARVSQKLRQNVADRGSVSVDKPLTDALGDPNAAATLEAFAEHLKPPTPGPILKQIRHPGEQG